jgi:hypothetical protein
VKKRVLNFVKRFPRVSYKIFAVIMFLVAASDCEAGVLAIKSGFIAVGSFYFLFSVILYYPFLFIRIFYVE